MGDPSSTSKELRFKAAPVAPTPRRCRQSDGPRSFIVHRIETECDYASDVDDGTGSIEWMDNGMGSRRSPVGMTTYTESGDPHNIVLCLPYAFEMDEYRETEGDEFTRKTFFFFF